MNLRTHTLAAIAALAIAAAAGCDKSEPVAGTDSTAGDVSAYVPTLAQVQAAVTMDADDAAVVSGALADWRTAADADNNERPFAGRRAGMAFLADVAPSLDNTQLADLVAFLGDFRDAHRAEACRAFRNQRMSGKWEKEMVDELGLSAAQAKQMEAFHAAMRTQMRARHQAMRDGDATPEQMQAFHDAQREQLAGILTPEQLAKLDALRAERRTTMREHAMDRMQDRAVERTAWLSAVLGLSDEQRASVEELLTTSMEARQAEMQQAIDDDAQGPHMAWKRHSEQRDDIHRAIENLLTPQQKERFEIVNRIHDRGPNRQQP